MMLGAGLSPRIGPRFDKSWTPDAAARRRTAVSVGTLVYALFVIALLIPPFRLEANGAGLERMAEFWRVPFASLYTGTDFHALTFIAEAAVLFAPLGFALGDLCAGGDGDHSGVASLAAFAGLGAFATGLELAQAWIPGSTLDVTSTLCYLLGGFAGFYARRALMPRGRSLSANSRVTSAPLAACVLSAAAGVLLMGWLAPAIGDLASGGAAASAR
jgi:hypothetical protein